MLTDEVKKEIEIALEHLDRFKPVDLGEEAVLDFDVEMASVEHKLNKIYTEMVEGELMSLVIWIAEYCYRKANPNSKMDTPSIVYEQVEKDLKQYLLEKKGNL